MNSVIVELAQLWQEYETAYLSHWALKSEWSPKFTDEDGDISFTGFTRWLAWKAEKEDTK